MFLKNKKKQDFISDSIKNKISLLIITCTSHLYLFYTNLAVNASVTGLFYEKN
jgi:hypothetical protein